MPPSRDSVVVSTFRCGRKNTISNPGHGKSFQSAYPVFTFSIRSDNLKLSSNFIFNELGFQCYCSFSFVDSHDVRAAPQWLSEQSKCEKQQEMRLKEVRQFPNVITVPRKVEKMTY